MNINEKTIALRNLEIEEKDFKEFHKYLNDFYGKRGVYPNRYGKDLQPRDVLKAIDSASSKRPKHDWEWDSLDREIVRDELIKMRKFDYPTQESAIKELYKVHEDETEDTAEITVGDYQTRYFDVCPAASQLYSEIGDRVEDMDMAERSAKLQDALFAIEKHILEDEDNMRWDSEKYLTISQNLVDQIMAMAEMMDLVDEHSYIQSHLETIEKALKGDEEVEPTKDTLEGVNEGKKVFKVNPGIGKVKYSISSHDGKKKHKDGSDFYDIETFKNKKDLEKAIKDYTSKGFKMESVNEADVPGRIPSQVKVKLEKAVSQIKDSNLTYPQRLKVLSHVLDSLNIDKKELTKMTTRLKGTLESVNEADVVGKTIFSDGKGKLFFGYYKTDDAVEFVDYKTWKKLGFKDVSKGDTNKDRVISAILKGQKQFNKKVDYNMWSKKTNPSFEEKMDWFIKNGWISNITKRGIKG